MKKFIIGLSLITVMAFVVACGTSAPAAAEMPTMASSNSPTTQPGAAQAVASGSVDVAISGFAFKPAELTVTVGTKVTWTNQDSVGHNVKAADGSWGSDTLSNGQSFSKVFDTAGTFDYVCTFHPGMTGKIIVTK